MSHFSKVLRSKKVMTWDLERERIGLENDIKTVDFTAKYMAVSNLHSFAQTHPDITRPETISALESVLKDLSLSSQKQSLFLYKQAAGALASIIALSSDNILTEKATSALENILAATGGYPHRAAAEALGSLPVSISGPKVGEEQIESIPSVKWQKILEENGINGHNTASFAGRSFVVGVDGQHKSLVIKLARVQDSPKTIYREAVWMEHLCSGGYSFPVRFNVPTALKFQGSYVFRLKNIPVRMPDEINIHPKRYAIGFIADKDYFTYPNNYRAGKEYTAERFREVMFRSAWLLGRLTSLGIVHTAPIGLFHNRVQRNRRSDNGLYEWQQGGRLDRWLGSCSYPNFGFTGIRDFEHLIPFGGCSQGLYRHIGTHILSLLLVTGSYFRNKDSKRVGLDHKGEPVDARDLFDKQLFKELIQGIYIRYYHGFVGRELTGEFPFNVDNLALRMIEEMGVDRYMEEILRVPDQNQMTDKEFRDFLKRRGYTDQEIDGLKKGAQNIVIHTGPHLGGFNQRISLPELIESVGAMSALCMVGRYRKEKFYGSV
jgi:hypothetical protein